MGTRSLTHVTDGYVSFYRQYDGYPEGHGKDLAEFLQDFTIVNGSGVEQMKVANGMSCLALQLVAHFKKSVGGFYAIKHNSKNHGEEFTYHIYLNNESKTIMMRITEIGWNKSKDTILFDGTPNECLIWIASSEVNNE